MIVEAKNTRRNLIQLLSMSIKFFFIPKLQVYFVDLLPIRRPTEVITAQDKNIEGLCQAMNISVGLMMFKNMRYATEVVLLIPLIGNNVRKCVCWALSYDTRYESSCASERLVREFWVAFWEFIVIFRFQFLMISTCIIASTCLAVLGSLLRWSWGPVWLAPLTIMLYCVTFHLGCLNIGFVQLSECFGPQVSISF